MASNANSTQHGLEVVLIVKTESWEEAERVTSQRLNAWFLETPKPPYPPGTLLYWRIKPADSDKKR